MTRTTRSFGDLTLHIDPARELAYLDFPNLRFPCETVELAYSEAALSGVRFAPEDDDCWETLGGDAVRLYGYFAHPVPSASTTLPRVPAQRVYEAV